MTNPSPTKSAGGNFRWVICGLLFLSVAVNYIDRNIIGILKMPLSKELGWSETDYAHIASAFSFSYAFGYLFGGRIMDWIGVKRGLPIFVFLWSVAAIAHGLCTYLPHDSTFSMNIPWFTGTIPFLVPMTALGFMSARIMLGLAEGGNFPGAIKTVAEWFPVRERALSTGIFNAGTNVGAVVCPLSVPIMYKLWGWPVTFYVTGALGFAWLVLWWWLYDAPEKHRHLKPAELQYIQSDQPPTVEKPKAPSWLSLLGSRAIWGLLSPGRLSKEEIGVEFRRARAVWAYLFASTLAGPVWTIYMFFLPDFLDKRYHVPLEQIGWWTAVFYFIAAFGGIAGGWLSGKLIGMGWTLNAARKISLLLCAVAVIPLFVAPYLNNIWLTVIIVGIAGSAHQGWSANLFSFVSDTMPKKAVGAVVGFGGFVAYFAGGIVAELIGIQLKQKGNYVLVFGCASLMYIISVTVLHFLVPKIQQVDQPNK